MSTGTFTLLTANLWNGAGCPEALSNLLDRHQPDVVVVQELHPRSAGVLRERYSSTFLRASVDTHGMGIAARADARIRELAMPRRNFIAARLRPPGWPSGAPDLEVVNVHLSCPNGMNRFPERRVQLKRLAALTYTDHRPRVLAGDFNTAVPMPAYFEMIRGRTDAAWQVAWRARSLRCLPRPTWGPTAGAPRVARIDHVLVEGLQALELEQLRLRGSDHDPLLVRLALRIEVTPAVPVQTP